MNFCFQFLTHSVAPFLSDLYSLANSPHMHETLCVQYLLNCLRESLAL